MVLSGGRAGYQVVMRILAKNLQRHEHHRQKSIRMVAKTKLMMKKANILGRITTTTSMMGLRDLIIEPCRNLT